MADGAPPRPPGRFVTLEGGEGAGKSTLAQALAARLASSGREIVLTREPGGSPGAEMVRHVLLSGAAEPLGPFAESLLFAAARDDHLETRIRPALARGAVVLCDRFADSTRAYQGAVGGVEPAVVQALERVIVGRTRPDVTLILDVPARVALERVAGRSVGPDRFERESPEFHARLREAFLSIARAEPERCVVIDANRPPSEVLDAALAALSARIGVGAP